MEIMLLIIALIIMASTFLVGRLTEFVKQLHSVEHGGLLGSGKKLNFVLTISSQEQKEEACGPNTNSSKNDLD